MATLGTMTSNIRVNIRDNSTTSANQMFTDAHIATHVNTAMRLIQRKWFPRLTIRTAAQTGLSYASGYSDTTDETNYARILEIFAATAGVNKSPIFKPVQEFLKIRSDALRLATGVNTASEASHWTCWREGTSTPASQGKWTVLIHPPVSTTAFSALVELEQADLSATTDAPDIPPEGCSMIEHLASYWLGNIKGVPWANSFLTTFPQLRELADAKMAEAAKDEGRG